MEDKHNPNWQDKFLGGTILGGFVVIAIVAALFALVTWIQDQTADVPQSSTHAYSPPTSPTPSPN